MWMAQRLRSMRGAPRRWPTGPKLLFVASCRALSPPRHRGSARPVWVPSPATWWVWRGIFDDSASSRRLFLAGGRLGCVTLLNRADDRRSLARVPRGFNIITAVFTRAAGGSTRVSLSHSSTLFGHTHARDRDGPTRTVRSATAHASITSPAAAASSQCASCPYSSIIMRCRRRSSAMRLSAAYCLAASSAL